MSIGREMLVPITVAQLPHDAVTEGVSAAICHYQAMVAARGDRRHLDPAQRVTVHSAMPAAFPSTATKRAVPPQELPPNKQPPRRSSRQSRLAPSMIAPSPPSPPPSPPSSTSPPDAKRQGPWTPEENAELITWLFSV